MRQTSQRVALRLATNLLAPAGLEPPAASARGRGAHSEAALLRQGNERGLECHGRRDDLNHAVEQIRETAVPGDRQGIVVSRRSRSLSTVEASTDVSRQHPGEGPLAAGRQGAVSFRAGGWDRAANPLGRVRTTPDGWRTYPATSWDIVFAGRRGTARVLQFRKTCVTGALSEGI